MGQSVSNVIYIYINISIQGWNCRGYPRWWKISTWKNGITVWAGRSILCFLNFAVGSLCFLTNYLQIRELTSQGFEVILVTSGAVGVGRQRLRYRKLINSRFFLSVLNMHMFTSDFRIDWFILAYFNRYFSMLLNIKCLTAPVHSETCHRQIPYRAC